jgi:hypothetical protein
MLLAQAVEQARIWGATSREDELLRVAADAISRPDEPQYFATDTISSHDESQHFTPKADESALT